MKNIIKLTEDAKNVLKSKETEIFYLMKIPVIPDEIYDQLVVAVASIGGTWSERHKGFVFSENPENKIEELLENGTYELSEEDIWKEKMQYYPTPSRIAKQMVELAELQAGDIVLEPSAGRGAILDEMPDYVQKVAIELDETNVRFLHEKNYQVFWGDFLGMEGLKPTKVIMNPPFSKSQDVQHVCRAYEIMETGGILVAIINENSLMRAKTNIHCKKFIELLNSIKHEIIHLPEGTFKESGTMINTVIVKLYK